METLGSVAREAVLDESRFQAWLEPLLHRAYVLSYHILQDRQAAEDAVQEATLAAWRRWHQRRAGSPDAWFLKIAVNKARDLRRRRWFHVLRLAEPPDRSEVTPAEDLDDRPELIMALGRLSRNDRVALILLHVMDLSHGEAAQILGLSERGLRSRERRALGRIRPHLEVSDER